MRNLLLTVLLGMGFSAFSQTYCTPAFASGCTYGDQIDSFAIPNAAFNHASTGCSSGSYGDFTAQTINLSAGVTYSFSVTHGYGSQNVRIWVDFNNDGVFDDAAPELMASGSSASVSGVATTNGTILIPSTTAVGNYRMRVGDRYSSQPIPCNTDGYGEAHDYTVHVSAAPSCLAPNNTSSNTITANSAIISWTAPTSTVGVGYEYYISNSSTAPTSTTVPSGTVSSAQTTATVSGLTPATQYYVWVRAKCSASNVSPWSVNTSFYTLCVAFTIPYAENFDTTAVGSYSSNNAPQCWSYLETNGSSGYGYVYNYNSNSSPNSYYLYNSSDVSGNIMLVSPQTTGLSDGTRRVRFYAKGYSGYLLEVGTVSSNTDASTFTSVSTITLTATQTLYTVNLPSGSNSFLAFKHGLGGSYRDIYIDDINVENIPSCAEPTLPSVVGVTSNTGTLTWVAPATAPSNGYQIYYSTSNSAPTSTTVIGGTNSATATTTTGQITGLTPATTYYAWVRSICSTANSSPWTPSVTFTTACLSTSVPYTLDFENVVAPALPICGAAVNYGSGNLWTTAAAPTDSPGFASKVLKYAYTYSGNANTWFYTQGINLTAGTQYTISYKYGNNSTTYVEKLKVSYGTSPTETSMTNTLADYNSINDAMAHTESLTFTPATTGVYYFGFNAYSDLGQYYLYVDDISIVNSVLSTSEIDATKNLITAYPNPFYHVLNISDATKVKNVLVTDVSGRLVKTIEKPSSALQLGDLKSGMYIVVLNMNDGSKQTIKAIKK